MQKARRIYFRGAFCFGLDKDAPFRYLLMKLNHLVKNLTRLTSVIIGALLLSRCADDAVPVTYPSVNANFTSQYRVLSSGELVGYTDQSTGKPTKWRWVFEGGDPATSTEENPQVQYKQPGTYPVKLIVSNVGKADTLIRTDYVQVFSLAANDPTKVTCDFDDADQIDEPPRIVEGFDTFYAHLADQIVYPDSARKYGIEGKVFVRFIISDAGNLGCVKVIEGIGYGCDEEAARAVGSFPSQWLPGREGNRLVNAQFIVPITFKLE